MSARSRYRASRIVSGATRWALARDPDRHEAALDPHHVGWIASVWATIKLGIVGILTPIWAPAIMVRAATNNRRAQRLTAEFPQQMRAIAAGRTPAPPSNRVLDIPADVRLVVFSDLHRCVPGRLDWPARQRTKHLYELILDYYADDDWSLCENGDIEDYWIVGGSTYGAVYDLLRMLGAAMARYSHTALLTETYKTHLDQIVGNNPGIYRRIRDHFVHGGRYFRTVGNHDNPNNRPMVADRLREHLGTFPIADYFALRTPNGQLLAVICHGHHTDGWNAPGRDNLGKLSAWIANTLIDVPRLETPEGLPPAGAEEQMLAGEIPDRLIAVNPTFGANSSYDSLDEELLCEAVRTAGLDDLWLILGHTHFPVSAPVSRTGQRWDRYMNSGSGVTDGVITAIEWDGTATTDGGDPQVRLVGWAMAGKDTPPEAIVITPSGQRLARYVLEHDGDRLLPSLRVPLSSDV